MNLILDASAVINLHNVDALGTACRLERCRFWLTPLVVGECPTLPAVKLLEMKANDALGFVDDAQIPTELFLKLLSDHRLGEGEIESIAACQAIGYDLCCDDKNARRLAGRIIGEKRVIGSLRILRWCVEEAWIDCAMAFDLFQAMRAAGGFLPSITQPFFCAGDAAC